MGALSSRFFARAIVSLAAIGGRLSVAAQTVPADVGGGEETGRVASSVQLKRLSLEDLMTLEVSTVSRKTEPWWSSAGAIDVITDDDIERSGAMTLPDALRLATGVHVGQPNTQNWAVGIRGFNVISGNKVNVQLDGRNLFTPFFSGVSWDVQDTMLEDIDRIEVVRGPAGALWGNYAMNGFIQIETKPAWDTQGLLVSGATGTELPGAVAVRYGGEAGGTFYRAFVKYTQTDWTDAGDTRAEPPTDVLRGGFRTDTRAADGAVLTFEGDLYTNRGTPKSRPNQERFSGEDLVARWHRELDVDSDLAISASIDDTWHQYAATFLERRHTLSASAKYHVRRGRHDLQFGVDSLVSRDRIRSSATITIEPSQRTYYTNSIYGEDAVTLVPDQWVLTAAGQLQWSAFSGLDAQPTLRVAWTPTRATTVWTALSRAVRTPVRLDADLTSRVNGVLQFEGNDRLKPETVIAGEVGLRHRFGERLAVDIATFSNVYDNIRTYESETSTYLALPWTFKNGMSARGTGVEVTVLYQPYARLFFKAGYRYLDFHLTKHADSGDFLNGLYEADDPRHVVTVTARADLGRHWTLDTTLRGASTLPRPPMNGYLTADARLGWSPNAAWELALIGQNLLQPRHRDFVSPTTLSQEIARSVTLKATWRF